MNTALNWGTPDDDYKHLLSRFSGRLVFIMGCHRSGTSMLYHLLAYTDAYSYISAYDIVRYKELLRNRIESREQQVKADLDAEIRMEKNRVVDNLPVGADYPEEYRFLLAPKAPRWFLNVGKHMERLCFTPHLTEETRELFLEICSKKQYLSCKEQPLLLKNPNDFYLNFAEVHRMFPDAAMIFIHRHPLHILNSYIAGFGALGEARSAYAALLDPAYQDFSKSRILRTMYRRAFGGSSLPRYIAAGLAQSYRYYLENIGRLPKNRYCTLKYEDLCLQPRDCITRIGKWLNIEAPPRISDRFVQPRNLEIAETVRAAFAERAEDMRDYLASQNYPLFPESTCQQPDNREGIRRPPRLNAFK